jgi:hypothetical protein
MLRNEVLEIAATIDFTWQSRLGLRRISKDVLHSLRSPDILSRDGLLALRSAHHYRADSFSYER